LTALDSAYRPAAWLAPLLLALTLVGVLLFGAGRSLAHHGPSAAAVGAPILHVEQAEFSQHDTGQPVRVSLPDTWAQRNLPGHGQASYRMTATLGQVAPVVWALRVDRLSNRHSVFVNGHLVSGGALGHAPVARPADSGAHRPSHLARPVPTWIELSPHLLTPGENRIELTVEHGIRGGLSSVWLGPAEALIDDYDSAEYFAAGLPRLLNAAGLALAGLLLLLWWGRRSERLLGGMGAMLGLACVRNLSYFAADTNTLDHAAGDWLYHLMQVLTATGVAHMALLLARRDHPGLTRTIWAIGLALVLLGVPAAVQGWILNLRTWSYPVLLAMVVPALAVAIAALRKEASHPRAALIAGLGMLTVASGHDYLCWRGMTSVMDVYWIPYAAPMALMATAGNMIHRLVTALSDVEQLNANLEVRVATRTRDLEAANQAKSRFIAAASHDLRQPAVAIGLLVGVLREQVQGQALRAMIDRVDDAVASMEGLLAGLLDLSRLEAGIVQPRLSDFALQPLFDAIAAHESVAARRKGLTLRLRPTRLTVRSDRVLLEQILRNLVSNALRFTDRGGVLVVARRQADQVRLQVWDSGRGVPDQNQTIIFEEFVQIDSPGGGLGLGLSIVQRTAALLGHRLGLRSVPGRGSCFSVNVPRAAGAAVALPGSAPRELALSGRHLVLVDDDAAVRHAMVDRLRQWGAEVTPFANLAALQAWVGNAQAHGSPRTDAPPTAARPPDMLITDQRLPDGTGLAALALLRLGRADLPGLVITGNTSAGDLAVLAASGVPVLHKPFRADRLLDAIRHALHTDPGATA
jgi:signal transduction histidine kinase/ActR/RegA family two-component response regulator